MKTRGTLSVVWSGLLTVLGFAVANPSPLLGETLWELRPYRIRVVVLDDGSPAWTPRRMDGVLQSLKHSASRTFGSQWELEVAVLDEPPQDNNVGMHADKAIVLTLSKDGNGFTAQAVERDGTSQLASPPVDVRFALLKQTNTAAFQAVAAAFSPVARITAVNGNQVHVRVRGSGLPTRDQRLTPFQVGSVARVAVTRRNAAAQELDWTFLVVETSNESEVNCRVVSRYENPLSAAGDPSDLLALQISASSSPTQLQLTSSEQPGGIAGLEVVAVGPRNDGIEFVGRSTSDGTVLVPAGKSRLRILHVRAGDQTIAQLPIVPGWQRKVRARLSTENDTVAALGGIAAARSRLIDLVLRRQVTLARAAARETAGEVQQAADLRSELRALLKDDATQLKRFIEQQRKRAEPTNPAERNRVNKSWDELLSAIDRETDPSVVE